MGGAHEPLSASASELLGMWETARTSWSANEGAAFLDLQLTTAFLGSVVNATRALLDVARVEKDPQVAKRLEASAKRFTELFGSDLGALQDAWDESAACPLGIGLPLLSRVRPDLPLQYGYSALRPAERLVFLAFAPEAGHRAVLVDAPTLARRTGLEVHEVHLALHRLFSTSWMTRCAHLSPSVAMATPAAFVTFTDGAWGGHWRSTHRPRVR